MPATTGAERHRGVSCRHFATHMLTSLSVLGLRPRLKKCHCFAVRRRRGASARFRMGGICVSHQATTSLARIFLCDLAPLREPQSKHCSGPVRAIHVAHQLLTFPSPPRKTTANHRWAYCRMGLNVVVRKRYTRKLIGCRSTTIFARPAAPMRSGMSLASICTKASYDVWSG